MDVQTAGVVPGDQIIQVRIVHNSMYVIVYRRQITFIVLCETQHYPHAACA